MKPRDILVVVRVKGSWLLIKGRVICGSMARTPTNG